MKSSLVRKLELHALPLTLIILGIAAFNLFFNLGGLPVLNWDEARHGITAAEILRSGDFIRTTYLGQTDYWNLKPPLGSILIAISYKIFGFSAFAMRFPSAMAAFLSVVLIILLARRRFGTSAALIAGAVLTTSFAFIEVHSGRSGDFDSGLVQLYILTGYFLDRADEKPYYLVLCGLTVSLAFLLKSFGFLPIGIIAFIYFFLKKLYRKPRAFYWAAGGLIAFLIPVTVWGIARYQVDGLEFFSRMITYDMLKRTSEAIEGHSASVLFYLEPFFLKFMPWSLVTILAFLYRARFRIYRNDKLELRLKTGLNRFWADPLMVLWFIIPALFLAAVKTRCEWYLNPLYPLFALAIGWLFQELDTRKPLSNFWGFIQKGTLPVLISSFMVAEIAILVVNVNPAARLALNEKADLTVLRTIITKQEALRAIPQTLSSSSNFVYATEWSPGDLFIARVEKNLEPLSLPVTNRFSIGYYLVHKGSLFQAESDTNRCQVVLTNSNWKLLKIID